MGAPKNDDTDLPLSLETKVLSSSDVTVIEKDGTRRAPIIPPEESDSALSLSDTTSFASRAAPPTDKCQAFGGALDFGAGCKKPFQEAVRNLVDDAKNNPIPTAINMGKALQKEYNLLEIEWSR